jgi:hypothetical protein
MKNLFLLLLIFSVLTISAQDNWLLQSVNFKSETEKLKEIIPVVNEYTGHFAMFFKGNNELKALLYNEDQKQIFEPVYIENLPKNFDVFINHIYSENQYTLFFKNNASKKYGCILINFETGKYVISNDLPIQLKGEKIVETFNDKNQLYFLTIKTNSAICYIYTFQLDGSFTKKDIDLSSIPFEKYNGSILKLSDFLSNAYVNNLLNKIDYNEPVPLEKTSTYIKIFYNEGVITILNNYYDAYTYIINISVNDITYNYKKIDNENFDLKASKKGSNSFIYEDYFFSVNATSDILNLIIYNYKNGAIVKEYQILKDKEITFKNTPIIREGGDFDNYRELEKTSQFLRKVSNPNLGVAIYRNDKNYIITLGSSQEVATGSPAMIGGMLGGAIGGAIGGALFATFDSYTKTRSTRIACVFDENFDHVEGEVPLNIFDKINNYLEEKNLKKKPLQTIFKYKNNYIWGCYNEPNKSYRLIKF